jgi:hypothetical protein
MSMPRVTEILSPFADFSMIPPDVLQAAAERGTAVHEACAAYAIGFWTFLGVDLEGYLQSFKSWFDRYVVEVLAVEEEVIHPAFGYIGHVDLIATVAGIRPKPVVSIIDYKSPMVESLTWHAQLSAYKEAAKEKYHVEACGALMLKRDGSLPKMVWIDDEPRAFAAFCAALSGHNYFNKKA